KLLATIRELEQDDNLSQQTIVNLQNEVAELEKKLTEELQQKEEMIRYYLEQLSLKNARIDDLEREKERLNNNLQGKQNEVDERDEEIGKLNAELQKEKGW
ncbi:7881_t:CDS:2, partial [Cetraspora pellucida]